MTVLSIPNPTSPFEIFVPGRLCIIGEHTDWIANYRKACPDLHAGHTLVCATNEGLHARVQTLPLLQAEMGSDRSKTKSQIRFIHRASETGCEKETIFEHILNSSSLKLIAKEGGLDSYVAGTTAAVLDAIDSGRFFSPFFSSTSASTVPFVVEIDNYCTTLPMKKGLSSSAAVCVLVVQSLALAFTLTPALSLLEIMDLAYQGEMTTPSQCGRMDQCVAMGSGAIALMTFLDEDTVHLDPISCNCSLYFVVVDLKSFKDTVIILKELNACFPSPKDDTQRRMHDYHREIQRVAKLAKQSIEEGQILLVAKAMKEAQELFDECAMPNCPSQLTSPKLHELVGDKFLRDHALAVKGVGSQGDGSAQILVENAEKQELVLKYVTERLKLDGFPLTIPAQQHLHSGGDDESNAW